MLRALIFAATTTVATGCTIDDSKTVAVASSGDLADFAAYVQPVLQVGCASLDCHGDAGRPLRLYARTGLRTDAALRGLEASDDEMLANMASIDGLEPELDTPEDHLLLLKPLSVTAGGIHHIGGDLWGDQSDAVYRCLHAWLVAGVSDDAGRGACSEVLP